MHLFFVMYLGYLLTIVDSIEDRKILIGQIYRQNLMNLISPFFKK